MSEAAHVSLIDRIESGELVDLEVDSEAGGLDAPGVASLSALTRCHGPSAKWCGSTESGSTVSGSRSLSSWSSFAARDAVELEGDLTNLAALSIRESTAREALASHFSKHDQTVLLKM